MILCGFRFLGRNLFHHFKRSFHTSKMRRVVVAKSHFTDPISSRSAS
jgi:hypothetical protein